MAHRSRPAALADTDILVVPGRGGSSADHWQSHFERRHATARRVEQDDWDAPEVEAWAKRIADAAAECAEPPLAVAHSFGCLALARAVTAHGAAIRAALMVAPADPARFAIPLQSIARRLDMPSLLVASENDPWLRAWQAIALAESWGSRYVNLGLVGHINVASGFGDWPAVDAFAELALCAPNGEEAHRRYCLHRSWHGAGPVLAAYSDPT